METFYHYRQCDYQATTEGSLDQHKKAVHEGINCSCKYCSYEATQKVNLARHNKSVHQRVKVITNMRTLCRFGCFHSDRRHKLIYYIYIWNSPI